MAIFNRKSIIFIAIVGLAGIFGLMFFQYRSLENLNNRFLVFQEAEQKESAISQEQIDSLVKQLKDTRQQVDGIISDYAKLQNKTAETVRQELANVKSQNQLLTEAVANISPSVVSVVISKDVPKLEVTYVNPFGNDPFFKDFGVQVPVYRQVGTEKQKVGAGTGFFVSANGYIVTNRHVVNDSTASYTVLLSDGSQKSATVVYKDPNTDAAILKIDGSSFKSVQLGDSGSLQLGQSVFAVGNALGEYNNSVSQGIISGLNRDIQASSGSGTVETLKGVIQTDAAINPGNSGGPLVDLNGKVVGINVATVVGSSNIAFSIPINTVKNMISSYVK